MNSCEVISGEFVVSGGNSPEILESAEGSFNDVSPFVSLFVEAMEPHPVRLVGNDGLGAEFEYLGAESVAVIAAVSKQCAHRRRESEDA